MSRSFRAARFLAALGLIALVAACSFSRFGYNQADTVAAWKVDEYFDLDSQQKQDFQKRFERFYGWHRNEQLPEYATFLRTARGKLQQGLNRDDVLWFVDGVRSRVRTAARRAGPETAAFLATLTPVQIENLQRKWDKDNKKYLQENKVGGTPEERQEVESKKVVKTFKEWLTPLNSEQEQKVTQMVRELPPIAEFRYAERLRRQKEFLAILQQRNEDREKFTARVTEWLANWERGRTADEQKKLDAWWQKRADIFVALDKSITREQRTASLERMQAYIDDCVHLARRDGGRTASAK
jgi:predicted transcriptional regulator